MSMATSSYILSEIIWPLRAFTAWIYAFHTRSDAAMVWKIEGYSMSPNTEDAPDTDLHYKFEFSV
jgi:hypothetical protein